jgi:hypothetical protein
MAGARGDYRACYCNMADDPDIHAMSGDAFKLLMLLKLTLPPAGIGVVYPSTLADQVNVDRSRLDVLLAELEAPKAGGDRGWIMRDGTTVWLYRGLECEPGMKSTSPNHRKNVNASVNKLSQRSPVVKAFRAAYAEWFDTPPAVNDPPPTDPPGDLEEFAKGSERVADSEAESKAVQNQSKSEAVDLEHPTAGADIGPVLVDDSVTASPAAQESANGPGTSFGPNMRRLLKENYDITGKAVRRGLSRRPQQVLDDARALLTDRGATLEAGVKVRAVDAQHLEESCARVFGKGIERKDAAFRLLLLDLRDTWQETKAAREKAELGEQPAADVSTRPAPVADVISSFSEQWRSAVARPGAAPPKAGAA